MGALFVLLIPYGGSPNMRGKGHIRVPQVRAQMKEARNDP